jgi:hypothetical protein
MVEQNHTHTHIVDRYKKIIHTCTHGYEALPIPDGALIPIEYRLGRSIIHKLFIILHLSIVDSTFVAARI